MITVQRILFPTDFSEPSLHALPHALEFARLFKAKLHVLHVVDEAFQYWLAAGPNALPVGPSQDEMMAASMRRMEDFIAHHVQPHCTNFQTSVRNGRPFVEIVHYAEVERVDLIVMGTHGRGGLAHALMGSVAEKVVRKAHCPVLTIRCRDSAGEKK